MYTKIMFINTKTGENMRVLLIGRWGKANGFANSSCVYVIVHFTKKQFIEHPKFTSSQVQNKNPNKH